jgi:hypothetical protein
MSNIFNYYEDEYYKIYVYNSKFKDLFLININYDLEYINIVRKDSDDGWGQNLNLMIRNKVYHNEIILNIGKSDNNNKLVYFKINNSNKDLHNHYENDNFKIFYISREFNDIFKINYSENEKLLLIKRLDNETSIGWGQNLMLKYFDKKSNNVSILNVGSSISNLKKVKFDSNNFFNGNDYVELNDDYIVNNYKSDNYIVTLYENKFNDKFMIYLFEENSTIYVKRVDTNSGWGQSLMLNVYSIYDDYNYIIYIGSSKENDVYKKLDLIRKKCFISLTTIPSRVVLPSFIENVNHILNNQTYEIEYLFITLAKKYKRFDSVIDENIIKELQNIPKVIVIMSDCDYGPASKYLCPLINYYQILKDNILVVIDDDRKYNKNLLRNFMIGYNSFPNIIFSSGLWNMYFDKNYRNIDENFLEIELYKEYNNNKFHYGQGLGGFFGFAIKVNNLDNFINYNLSILNRIPKSFYHDEGIILGYLKYNESYILYLKHYGCNYIDKEMVDALCTSNYVDRGSVEKEILRLTNLENII